MQIDTAPALEPIKRLRADLRKAAVTLSPDEARFLVDLYYQMQRDRIRAAHQTRTLSLSHEPHETLQWFGEQFDQLETQIKGALHWYAKGNKVGRWSLSITGIGPVISAGLLAHINIEKVKGVGAIWRFAGLDPSVTWEKGEKRPWNTPLKTLAFKIGESFIKVQNNENDFYGKLYVQRRAREEEKNNNGEFADQARRILESKKIGKETDAYKAYIQGKLPPAHLLSRARRWTVKLFLSHWFEIAYTFHYGTMPPKPFAHTILGHSHYIEVPNDPR